VSAPGCDLGSLVREAAARLSAAGIQSARVDAELLAAHLLGVVRGELVALLARGGSPSGPTLSGDRLSTWHRLVERRAAREPLQHLTGTAGFRRLELAVGPGVFVPRPETEGLVEAVLAELVKVGLAQVELAQVEPGWRGGTALVVDACSGSAAVALAVADEHPRARLVALELDPVALAWAARNIAALDAGARVELREGDVRGAADGDGALSDLVGLVDVVAANPPYIPDGAVPLDPEVADHDPHQALFGGGADGLDVPRAVVATAARLLRPGGLLLMEHADVQGVSTRALAREAGLDDVSTLVDLAGRDRVLSARRGG
jgi:release factor glutamine methyltransferase